MPIKLAKKKLLCCMFKIIEVLRCFRDMTVVCNIYRFSSSTLSLSSWLWYSMAVYRVSWDIGLQNLMDQYDTVQQIPLKIDLQSTMSLWKTQNLDKCLSSNKIQLGFRSKLDNQRDKTYTFISQIIEIDLMS